MHRSTRRVALLTAVLGGLIATMSPFTSFGDDNYPTIDGQFSETDVLRLAAGAEHPSEHPLGRAIVGSRR